jgi:hypothetical protein
MHKYFGQEKYQVWKLLLEVSVDGKTISKWTLQEGVSGVSLIQTTKYQVK